MMEELSRLPGLGPARVRALEKAGVHTLRDLVMRLPVAYRDLTAPTPLREAHPGLECAVAARVVGEPTEQFAPRLRITRVRIADESGDAVIIWCIERGFTLAQCDDELYRLGERTLVNPEDGSE